MDYRVYSTEDVKITSLPVIPDLSTKAEEANFDVCSSLQGGFIAICKGRVYEAKIVRLKDFKRGLHGYETALQALQFNQNNLMERVVFLLGTVIDRQRKPVTLYSLRELPPLGTLGQLMGMFPCHMPSTTFIQSLPAVNKSSMVLDLFQGLSWLHGQDVLHGCLHPDNVHVYPGHRIKLAEFGCVASLQVETRNAIWKSKCSRYIGFEVCEYLNDFSAWERKPSPKGELSAPPILPASDIYSAGAIILLIITGKPPYSNIDVSIDVINTVLAKEPPHVPNLYRDKELYLDLEQFMLECISFEYENRPSVKTSASIVLKRLEDIFASIDIARREQERKKRSIKIKEIEAEIRDYEEKIADLDDLIVNGRKLIKQRQSNLILLSNAQDRREADLAIEKAIMKLTAFEEEFEGLRIDLGHAKEDLEELNRRQQKVVDILQGGSERILSLRNASDESNTIDQLDLIDRYCLSRDREYAKGLIGAARKAEQGHNETLKAGKMVKSLGDAADKSLYTVDAIIEQPFQLPQSKSSHSSGRSIPSNVSPSPASKTKTIQSTSQSSVQVDSDDDVDISSRNGARSQRGSVRKSFLTRQRASSIRNTITKGIARAAQIMDDSDDETEELSHSELHQYLLQTNKKSPADFIAANKIAALSSGNRNAQPDSDDEMDEQSPDVAATSAKGSNGNMNKSLLKMSQTRKDSDDEDDIQQTQSAEKPQKFEYDSDDDERTYDDEVERTVPNAQTKNGYSGKENGSFLNKDVKVDGIHQDLRNNTATKVLAKMNTGRNSHLGGRVSVNDLLSTPAVPRPSHAQTMAYLQRSNRPSTATISHSRSDSKASASTNHRPSSASSAIDSQANANESYVIEGELTPWEQLEIEYIAAARGSWDEAIGMKLAGYRFDDNYVNSLIDKMETPVHLAASTGHLQVLKRLVEGLGFDPWTTDVHDRLPLHLAARRGQVSVVKYLLESCQFESVLGGYANPVDIPDQYGLTSLILAVTGGHINVLTYLLEFAPEHIRSSPATTDPDFRAPLLHWACISDQHHIVAYLIDTHYVSIEARAKADNSTCLLWAAYGGSVETLHYLMKMGAKQYPKHPPKGFTCLHLATASGSIQKTKYLLENGFSMTDTSEEGLTPFDVATGKCKTYLQQRKEKGFLTGSVINKVNKKEK